MKPDPMVVHNGYTPVEQFRGLQAVAKRLRQEADRLTEDARWANFGPTASDDLFEAFNAIRKQAARIEGVTCRYRVQTVTTETLVEVDG